MEILNEQNIEIKETPQLPTESKSIRPKIPPQVFKELSQVSSWKSIALTLSLYGLVVLVAFLGGKFSGYLFAIPAMAIIAGIQFHFLILLHEGSHGLIHPNKKLNMILSDIFFAIPHFSVARNYKYFHLNHHRFSGDKQRDPETPMYNAQGYNYQKRTKAIMFTSFFFDLIGVNFLRFLFRYQLYFWNEHRAGRNPFFTYQDGLLYLLVWAPVIALTLHFGLFQDLLIFWILPQVTFMFFFFKLHGYGEHTGLNGPTEYQRTWIHEFNPVTNFFLYPIKSGYHLEHHLFPTIPWYNMEKFRKILHKDANYLERSKEYTADGFFFGKKTIFKGQLAK